MHWWHMPLILLLQLLGDRGRSELRPAFPIYECPWGPYTLDPQELELVECWELDLGTLGEQRALLTVESSLRPLTLLFEVLGLSILAKYPTTGLHP